MPFIDPTDPRRVMSDPDMALLIGPADGARTIFRIREHCPKGLCVSLHIHHGDEAFQVMHGEIRFYVGGERRVCRAGEIVFVPPDTEHGFVALSEAEIEIFSEQKAGIYVVVLEDDGHKRLEEVFIAGSPWSREPPEGAGYTPREHVSALFSTTRHLS